MNKLAIVLAVLTTFLMAGCAAQKTTSAAPAAKIMMDDSVLPEIAAYDDDAYDALPDMVAAE